MSLEHTRPQRYVPDDDFEMYRIPKSKIADAELPGDNEEMVTAVEIGVLVTLRNKRQGQTKETTTFVYVSDTELEPGEFDEAFRKKLLKGTIIAALNNDAKPVTHELASSLKGKTIGDTIHPGPTVTSIVEAIIRL